MGVLARTIMAMVFVGTISTSQLAMAADFRGVFPSLQSGESLTREASRFVCTVSDAVSGAAGALTVWKAESAVRPIWQIEVPLEGAAIVGPERAATPSKSKLEYITDVYKVSRDVSRRLLLDPVANTLAAGEQLPAMATPVGMRLENGWSLGLSYETIVAQEQADTQLMRRSSGPEYEGPMLTATIKF